MMMDNPHHFASGAQTDAVTLLSLPEINAVCLRAARGIGWSWGMAEECGEAASWLAIYGLPWADIILNCLQNPASTAIFPAPKDWRGKDICGLHAGATLAEFANLPEGPAPEGLTLGTVRDARLLLPFVARCAVRLDTTLRITITNRPWAEVTGRAIALSADETMSGPIFIQAVQPSMKPTHTPTFQAAPISNLQKASLDSLALKMTVPSSAQSEAGAGGDRPDTE